MKLEDVAHEYPNRKAQFESKIRKNRVITPMYQNKNTREKS